MTDDVGLVSRDKRTVTKLLAAITSIMVIPPTVAGLLGSLGLAVVVGVLSLFVAMLGLSLFVYRRERWQRSVRDPLPKARLLPKG